MPRVSTRSACPGWFGPRRPFVGAVCPTEGRIHFEADLFTQRRSDVGPLHGAKEDQRTPQAPFVLPTLLQAFAKLYLGEFLVSDQEPSDAGAFIERLGLDEGYGPLVHPDPPRDVFVLEGQNAFPLLTYDILEQVQGRHASQLGRVFDSGLGQGDEFSVFGWRREITGEGLDVSAFDRISVEVVDVGGRQAAGLRTAVCAGCGIEGQASIEEPLEVDLGAGRVGDRKANLVTVGEHHIGLQSDRQDARVDPNSQAAFGANGDRGRGNEQTAVSEIDPHLLGKVVAMVEDHYIVLESRGLNGAFGAGR